MYGARQGLAGVSRRHPEPAVLSGPETSEGSVGLLGRHGRTEAANPAALVPIAFEYGYAEGIEALLDETASTCRATAKIERITSGQAMS